MIFDTLYETDIIDAASSFIMTSENYNIWTWGKINLSDGTTHIMVYINDIEQTLDFYNGIGFKFTREQVLLDNIHLVKDKYFMGVELFEIYFNLSDAIEYLRVNYMELRPQAIRISC